MTSQRSHTVTQQSVSPRYIFVHSLVEYGSPCTASLPSPTATEVGHARHSGLRARLPPRTPAPPAQKRGSPGPGCRMRRLSTSLLLLLFLGLAAHVYVLPTRCRANQALQAGRHGVAMVRHLGQWAEHLVHAPQRPICISWQACLNLTAWHTAHPPCLLSCRLAARAPDHAPNTPTVISDLGSTSPSSHCFTPNASTPSRSPRPTCASSQLSRSAA